MEKYRFSYFGIVNYCCVLKILRLRNSGQELISPISQFLPGCLLVASSKSTGQVKLHGFTLETLKSTMSYEQTEQQLETGIS